MKVVLEEKKLVMGLYFFTLLILLLCITDYMPFVGILNKVKYVYIAFIIFFSLYDGVIIFNKRVVIVLGLLLLHTILYGIVFVNPVVLEMTRVHFEQLITYYLIAIFTCLYIYKKDCFLEFIRLSYWALAVMLLLSALIYLGDFVNPIYFVNIFSESERYRSAFGLGDVNYCANYCLYALVLSVVLKEEWKKRNILPSNLVRYSILFVNFIIVCMLCSTASRSALLSFALFLFVYFLLKKKELIMKYKVPISILVGSVLIGIVLVMVSNGTLQEIWGRSNREGNFSINYPIFLQHGNLINGMGYIDNSGFLNYAYGYETTAMDVYFLYIPFTTGIIGSLIIVLQMVYILYNLIRYKNVTGRNLVLSLYIMMLFYAVWQVNYMNNRYYTSIIHMVIILLFLMRIGRVGDNFTVTVKRR